MAESETEREAAILNGVPGGISPQGILYLKVQSPSVDLPSISRKLAAIARPSKSKEQLRQERWNKLFGRYKWMEHRGDLCENSRATKRMA